MSTSEKRELLSTALRFFCNSVEQKAKYLSAISAGSAIYPGENEEPFLSPHHAFAVIATDVLENYLAAYPAGEKGEWEIIRDMVSVLLMMNDLSDQEYFWFLDKEVHPTSGPHDGSWRVLARLAEIALGKFGWSKEGPMVEFRDILLSLEFVVRATPADLPEAESNT